MNIKDRMTDDIVRFYISPEGKFSFANIKTIFNDKPYKKVLSQIENTLSVKENTDINYDSNFNYSVSNGLVELFLMISMVGRYAIIYSNRRDIFEENYANDSVMFTYLKKVLFTNGIELVNGHILKSKAHPLQVEYRNLFDKNLFYYLFERE